MIISLLHVSILDYLNFHSQIKSSFIVVQLNAAQTALKVKTK